MEDDVVALTLYESRYSFRPTAPTRCKVNPERLEIRFDIFRRVYRVLSAPHKRWPLSAGSKISEGMIGNGIEFRNLLSG